MNLKTGILAALAVPAAVLAQDATGETPQEDNKPGFVKIQWSASGGETWEIKGVADRESGRPMASNTIFSICSNTKPVTSVFALTFVEEGLLSLDDPVSKYLPEFENVKYKGNPPKRPVTLRQCLTHLSGLKYNASTKDRKPDMLSYAEHVKYAVENGMRGEPGEAYQYCNLGFQVFGAVIEKITGRKVADLMKERIFDPLGMTETTFYPSDEMISRLATPYYYPPEGGAPVKYGIENIRTPPYDNTNRTAVLSSGIFCTAGDYLKFAQMMALKGVGTNGKRIISEKTFDEYLATRQTPPGDKTDASFDIHFNARHTGGGKGGLLATYASWDWKDKTCLVNFRSKYPYPPKWMKAKMDASGFGGKKTTFVVSEINVEKGQISCLVSNNEDRHGIAKVKLAVNGKSVKTKSVELAIGEAKRVSFKYEASSEDKVEITAVAK